MKKFLIALLSVLLWGATAQAQTAYEFICTDDVLEFSGIDGITVNFNSGKYTVDGNFAAATSYTYLTITLKEGVSENYKLSGIQSSYGVISAVDGRISFSPYYYPAPITWTVNFDSAAREDQGWVFEGPQGLKVFYTYNNLNYPYSGGKYMIDDIQIYGTVEISVLPAYTNNLAIEKVTVSNGQTLYPENGIVKINVQDLVEGDEVPDLKFVIYTFKPDLGESATLTVSLMEGNASALNVYVGNSTVGYLSYDFFDARTIGIPYYPETSNVFITTTGGMWPYQITIDGRNVPESEWDFSEELNMTGLMLKPGDEYYPSRGGLIEVFIENPVKTTYDITFSFANEGTESFIQQLGIAAPSQSMIYYSQGSETFDNAMSEGLKLVQGSSIELRFNNVDYTVNNATYNGVNLNTSSPFIISGLEDSIDFIFDVTPAKTNAVTFTVTGDFEQLSVVDRNFAGESDADKYYTLTAEESTIQFKQSVEEIKLIVAEGYEIPLSYNGKPGLYVTYPAGSRAESGAYKEGDYFQVVDGMTIDVAVTKIPDASERVFTVYSEADVLEFTGLDTEYKPANPVAVWTAPASEGEKGHYTLTDIPEGSLYIAVAEEYTSDYTINYVTYVEQGNYPIYGPYISLPVRNITGNATFDVFFKKEIPARNITIETNNASCISRIYNSNITITSFPYTYNLNDGAELYVEMRNNCTLDAVTCNGANILEGNIINLADVEEGDVVKVAVSVNPGDYTYAFTGVEGITVKYNNILASFIDGQYIVNNVYASSKNDYPLQIEVADGYQNKIKLVSVTDGINTWEFNPGTGQIIIPGSELPAADTDFTIITDVPLPSETTRTVYVTIDDINVVSYGVYHGGSSAYWSFAPTGDNDEGIATLTISPDQYEIEIVTSKRILSIITDVENTFEMPALPATRIELNLLNCIDGQTISLLTASSGVEDLQTPKDENQRIFNLNGQEIKNSDRLEPGIYIIGGKKKIVR